MSRSKKDVKADIQLDDEDDERKDAEDDMDDDDDNDEGEKNAGERKDADKDKSTASDEEFYYCLTLIDKLSGRLDRNEDAGFQFSSCFLRFC